MPRNTKTEASATVPATAAGRIQRTTAGAPPGPRKASARSAPTTRPSIRVGRNWYSKATSDDGLIMSGTCVTRYTRRIEAPTTSNTQSRIAARRDIHQITTGQIQ